MKMRKVYFIFLVGVITVLFTANCPKNKEDVSYKAPSFPLMVERTIQNIDPHFLVGPGDINIIDSLLCIDCETDITEKKLHLFNKETGRYITSFGKIGQGPGELSNPISRITIDDKKGVLYVCDLGKKKLIEFDIKKILNEESEISSEVNLCPVMGNNIHFLSLKNDHFIAAYSAFKGVGYRFVKGDKNDTITTCNRYVRLSEPDEYQRVEASYFLYLSHVAVSPDGTKLANATSSGCILEIFDVSGDKIVPLYVKRFYEPRYKVGGREAKYPFVQINDSAIGGVFSIKATADFLYCIFSSTNSYNSKNIAVFDWKGNPVKMYTLDHNIGSFAIDESTQKGYVTFYNGEDINLGSFDL